jgi:hypothetical protein
VNWTPLGAGTNGRVAVLTSHNGSLVAGGDFTTAGGNPASHIATWNSSDWLALGSGTNGSVLALLSSEGRLFAGGSFSRAGDKSSVNIARWDAAVSAVGDADGFSDPISPLLTAGPNPFRSATTLDFQVPAHGPVRLTVHDVQGRLVDVLENDVREAGTYRVSWTPGTEAGRTPPGVYWVRLVAGRKTATVRLVLIP